MGLLLVAVVAVAACGGTKTTTETVTVSDTTKAGAGPPRVRVEYGHIRSLTRQGDHFTLRFDPAWFLTGVTANEAAAEDGAVEPGQPVPNDNYVVDEDHRLLTYVVPEDTDVTVLTRNGDAAQLGATPITVSELAQIVRGKSALQLSEPLATGVWISVDIDTVGSIDQQYRP
jgi:hypothetical protein